MGRKLKDTFSELKRVTWPTFPKVVKSTCVVLVVVAAFLVVATGIKLRLTETFLKLLRISERNLSATW